MRRYLLLVLCLFILPTLVLAGGPWVRGHRKGFLQIGYSGLYYNAVFNAAGAEQLPYISLGGGTKRTYFFGEVGYGFMTQNYSNFLKVNGERNRFGYHGDHYSYQ